MTAQDFEHYLTDDELVAVAAETSGRWPTPLPTVDVADVDQLRASAHRGAVSLFLRGGVRDGRLNPELQAIGEAAGAAATLVLYVGGTDAIPTDGFRRAAVPLDTSWLLDETDGAGLHQLSRLPDEAAVVAYLGGFAGLIRERGLPDAYGDSARLWLVAVLAERTEALLVDGRSAASASLTAAGQVKVGAQVSDVGAAVAALVRRVAGAAQ